MITALDLANRSLKAILVEAADSPLEPDDYQDYYDALNSFMSDLESREIRLGFTPVSGPSDIVTIPDGAVRGVAANMAIEVSPDYGGKVSPYLERQARKGMRAIRRLGQAKISSSYPGTLSRGTGSDSYPYRNDVFFGEGVEGVMWFTGSALVTSIAAMSAEVKVKGEWATSGFESLSADVSGRVTNTTESPRLLHVDLDVTATCGVSVSANVILMRNGAEAIATTVVALSSTRGEATVSATVTLNSGEYIEAWISNDTDDTDITVIDARLRAR